MIFQSGQEVEQLVPAGFVGTTASVRSGVDRVELTEFAHILDAAGDCFLDFVYTPDERDFCAGRIERLASRFAAKEATTKALGTGIRGLGLREIEIISLPSGQPKIVLHHRAADRACVLGITAISVSLTHTTVMAEAFVVALADIHPSVQQVKEENSFV